MYVKPWQQKQSTSSAGIHEPVSFQYRDVLIISEVKYMKRATPITYEKWRQPTQLTCQNSP